MGDSFPKRFFKLFLILIPTLIISLFSCNSNTPRVSNSKIYVVLDYLSKDSLPEVRLNIFCESLTDPRLLEKMEVEALAEGYKWSASDIIKIENPNNFYAGYSNFVMPENLNFPKGTYNAKFIAYNGEEAPFSVYLNYREELCSLNSKNLERACQNEDISKNLAIYNEEGVMQYYGSIPENLYEEDGFLSNYQKNFYYREIWTLNSYNQIILLPKVVIEEK